MPGDLTTEQKCSLCHAYTDLVCTLSSGLEAIADMLNTNIVILSNWTSASSILE